MFAASERSIRAASARPPHRTTSLKRTAAAYPWQHSATACVRAWADRAIALPIEDSLADYRHEDCSRQCSGPFDPRLGESLRQQADQTRSNSVGQHGRDLCAETPITGIADGQTHSNRPANVIDHPARTDEPFERSEGTRWKRARLHRFVPVRPTCIDHSTAAERPLQSISGAPASRPYGCGRYLRASGGGQSLASPVLQIGVGYGVRNEP